MNIKTDIPLTKEEISKVIQARQYEEIVRLRGMVKSLVKALLHISHIGHNYLCAIYSPEGLCDCHFKVTKGVLSWYNEVRGLLHEKEYFEETSSQTENKIGDQTGQHYPCNPSY